MRASPNLDGHAVRFGLRFWLIVASCASTAVSASAQRAVTEDQTTALELINRLSGGTARSRDQALKTLTERTSQEYLPVLHRALLSPKSSSRARWRIAATLGAMGDRDSIAPLSQALTEDKDRTVRREAARALGSVGDPSAAPVLVKAMENDQETWVRKRAASALFSVDRRLAKKTFKRMLKSEKSSQMRGVMAWLLKDPDRRKDRIPRVSAGRLREGWYQGTQYYLYVPESYDSSKAAGLLVSVHGTDVIPRKYAKRWFEDAERHGLVVLAPRFDFPTFPLFGGLNIGFGLKRADIRLLDIIDQVAQAANIDTRAFYLFGHSRGGQFVQRFVMAHPHRIVRAVASGSGNYVHPDSRRTFPDGIDTSVFAPDLESITFDNLVKTRLAIVVGTEELQRRLDQATRFIEEVREYARTHQLDCRIQYTDVLGCGHSGGCNQPAASKFLFGAPP